VGLMPVAEALARVLADAEPLPAQSVPLTDAHARVLTADVEALRTQPPGNVSAMDGYAVRAIDIAKTPARLKLVGEVAAGHPFDGMVGRGEAARIFTGGLLPHGSDTIVVQENTTREGNVVVITASTAKGKHVRIAGLDFRRGAVLLAKGRRLSDRDLALAAAMNHPSLPVHRRPKLAILATGDELVMPGSSPAPGEIVYSNGYATMAMAHREGCELIDLGIVPDRLDRTVEAVRRARDQGADILATSGGASVGDHDLVRNALASEGLALSFWKVALRPGRPMLHGRLGAMHVLGLPGNPVSAYVCSVLFLLPLIRRLAGRSDIEPALETALLGCDLPQNDERADYLRAQLTRDATGMPIATPSAVQDSSMLAPLAAADCLLIRDPYAPAAPAGSRCRILRLVHGN
jgi:molybdopterin molybdotransferase